MQKIIIELPKQRQIQIEDNEKNTGIYDVLVSDHDVFEIAIKLQDDYETLAALPATNTAEQKTVLRSILEASRDNFEIILGEGSLKKILKNRPLGFVEAQKLMIAICEAIVQEYNADINKDYE